MTAHKSTQQTKLTATPPKPLSTTELKGRVRIGYFDFTVPAGNAAIDDTIAAITIPAGARLLGGFLTGEAMTSGGAAASVQVGDGTTADKYLGTTSVDAAFGFQFGHTYALGYGQLLTEETTLTLTVKTEALAATKVLAGHVFYVLD